MRVGVGFGALLVSALVVDGCVLDWNRLDPRADEDPTVGAGGSSGGGATTGATTGAGGATTSGAGGAVAWFDPAWTRRRTVTVEASIDTLDDFVVRVRLDDTRIDPSATKASGADLRFVASDHRTVLPHAIERWDPAARSEVWVRLPTATTGTTFFMYYGNPAAPLLTANPFEGYAGVWHLSDPRDASGNGTLATVVGSQTFAAGQIADGSDHRPTFSFLDLGAPTALDGLFAEGGTISGWIRPDGFGGTRYGRIVDRSTSTDAAGGWSFHLNAPAGNVSNCGLSFERGGTISGASWRTQDLSVINLAAWHHVAVVFDDRTSDPPAIYVDAQPAAVVLQTAVSGTWSPDAGTDARIGGAAFANDRTFDGVIDELRLERRARTAEWIQADYLSTSDQLLSFGSEETR